jgi:hypothetical protein
MVGPSFDPFAAKTMSDEITRAEQGDAKAAREHRLEDFEAARTRTAWKRGDRGVWTLVRRLFGRGR